ncbi:MAG: hypothetical protein LBQ69_00935 [Treponema sp.]|jgi:hypothetical protein|nr:hypothetical protein [Treponema sp.]
MINIPSALKDRAIFLGWIAGLALLASLAWSLSFQFRSACLMRSANRVLVSMKDDLHLSAPLAVPFAAPGPLGCWYSLVNSNSRFFVFAIMRDGILVPCGAEVSETGEVTRLVPLGSHARKVMSRIPQGVIQVYVRRIESAVAKGMAGR